MLIRGALAGAFLGYATSLAVLVTVQTGLGIWGSNSISRRVGNDRAIGT